MFQPDAQKSWGSKVDFKDKVNKQEDKKGANK
jgi:hypothetical protein